MALQESLQKVESNLAKATDKLEAINEAYMSARRDVDAYSYEKSVIQAYIKIEQDVENIYLPTEWICANVHGFQYLIEMMTNIQPTIEQDGRTFIFHYNKIGYGKMMGTNTSRGYRNCPKQLEYNGYPANGYYFAREQIRELLSIAAQYPNNKDIFLAVVLLLTRLEDKGMICTTYQYIAERLDCSASAVKKVLGYLIDNDYLIRLHAGTIFTTGSVYKFNPDNILGNLKLTIN